MMSNQLMEIDTKGSFFTWLNNREGEGFIRERLDRAISNCSWKYFFLNGHCKVLEAIGSDHCPLLICKDSNDKTAPYLFRFDLRWLSHPEYEAFIKSKWIGSSSDSSISSFAKNLSDLALELRSWSKKEFRNSSKLINKLLDQIQSLLNGPWSNHVDVKLAELRRQLNDLWNQEEIFWAQKSKIQWLICGDQNSKFFHMTTMQRRSRNWITRLRLSDDSWIEDEEQIGNNFAQFYKNLFNSLGSRNLSFVLEGLERSISSEDNSSLMQEISSEEIKVAVFELGSNKAPGLDGFTGAFYQKAWDTVGDQVFATDLPGKYLGLPIIWERSKKNSLNFIVDKVKKKIQGWKQNFLSDAGRENPDQIWAKLLKAKYFPKCSFMEAQKGGRASWLWSSIVEGRKILQGNVLASVGNGENTCVWNDPWIPNLPGKIFLEFWEANFLLKNHSPQGMHSGFSTSLKKWKPLDPDWLKINTDAAFNEDDKEASIVFTVRDSSGWLLDGSSQIVSSFSSLHAECLALEAAVLFAKENELHNISFESDCQILVNYLTLADSIPDWTCDVIIDNIRTSGAFIRNHSFQWIPREANVVADWIANASLSRSCPPDWIVRPPTPLEQLLTS